MHSVLCAVEGSDDSVRERCIRWCHEFALAGRRILPFTVLSALCRASINAETDLNVEVLVVLAHTVLVDFIPVASITVRNGRALVHARSPVMCVCVVANA